MKKEAQSKKKSIELQKDIKSIIVPIAILTLFAVLIGVTIVNGLSLRVDKQEQMSDEDKLWEKAFYEAEKNRVGILFDTISTSNEEYERLRVACNEYMQDNKEGKKVDAEVSVDTIVDEEQFIDGNNKSTKEIKKETVLSETGPIYFQDMLMIRYINSDGTLKVITSLFGENKESIKVTRQNKLAETVKENKIQIEETIKEKVATSETTEINYTTEDEYLGKVDNTLKSMLLAVSFEEIRAAESMAINYFTVEGKQTVFGNRKDIKLSQGSTIETLFIEAGKSDSSKTYKDRIYTQLRVTVGDETFDTYIILKLNNLLRIYDIDII